MLNSLRTATKTLHEELEKENLAKLIISHKISLEQYKLLLLQNYIAYTITEAEISKYLDTYRSQKTAQLRLDLQKLNLDASIANRFNDCFSIHSYPEALGAAYVVLGSALGGVYISKEISSCPALQEIPKPHFFNGGRQGVKIWNSFVKELKAGDFTEIQKDKASKKAMETFEFFAYVFKETAVIPDINC